MQASSLGLLLYPLSYSPREDACIIPHRPGEMQSRCACWQTLLSSLFTCVAICCILVRKISAYCLLRGIQMSEEQPHKHRRWRGPIIAFVLGIPVISSVIVTSITLLFLYSANALRLSWDSLGAIGLSLRSEE